MKKQQSKVMREEYIMICAYCGTQVADNVNFCPSCGAQVTLAQKSEPQMQQTQQTQQTPYAPYIQQADAQAQMGNSYMPALDQKSKLAAGLLAIFLGSLGIHNFYLGNKTKGLVQILVSLVGGLFTCGLATIGVSIWALIEGIQIFTGTIATDAYGIPLKD